MHRLPNTDGLSGISRIFLEHNSFLKKFLTRFLNREQDIEDVAQEAYLKAYIAEQDGGEIERPKAFLFSIAKNLALNELTRKSRQMTGYIEECQKPVVMEAENTADKEAEAWESLGIYCEAVATLPKKCRQVYLLRKVHGLRHKEIAERLDISLSTVEKNLRVGASCCHEYIRRHSSSYPAARKAGNRSCRAPIGGIK